MTSKPCTNKIQTLHGYGIDIVTLFRANKFFYAVAITGVRCVLREERISSVLRLYCTILKTTQHVNILAELP